MQNIKIFWVAFILLFSVQLKAQENITDLLSVPGPIDFNNTEFFLAWSKQNSKTLSIQQYLPREETIDNFTQLINFSYFNKEIDMEMAIRQKVESIQDVMKKDKFAKVDVTESPDGKEFIVDYTVSNTDDKGSAYLEYNINRFKSYDNNGAKAFLILSYASRIYGDDYKSASRYYNKQRDLLLNAMADYKIPEIKLNQSAPSEKK